MIAGKRVLITGGAGFIGSELASRLVEQNDVIAYDHLSRNSLGNKTLLSHSRFELVKGDVLDREALVRAMDGVDTVVHCAAVAGIDTVVRSPVATMKVNMLGTLNVLELASQVGVPGRVVCFSTSEIFGQLAYHSAETDPAVVGNVGEARWTYAVGKLAAEHMAIAFHREHNLPTVVLRPFNVYGPGQVGEGALRTFIQRAIKDEPIEVHGDGTQIRAWCYLEDMVDAALLAITNENAVGESFNIGNPRVVTTIYDLARTVIRVLDSRSEIVFSPRSLADVELRVPSVRKAEEVLGFKAKVDLEEGITRTGAYYARHSS
ncbi:MAG: UDP-glucose 4-epimerase [Thermoleophilaceae bacterium]|jgi:UDP-glucose 4-epimerase|nr:UDP-glucose 4-epimerase [Thermoleophilaceae bacterium]